MTKKSKLLAGLLLTAGCFYFTSCDSTDELIPDKPAPEGLSKSGALGLLGFSKDSNGNYIVLIKQNNVFDNAEMRLSKASPNGDFIADNVLLGGTSTDNGKTDAGNPGGAGSGRLAYNPDKNEISVFSCFTGKGHQYSTYSILNNDNALFGQSIDKTFGNMSYSHCFDQRTIYHSGTRQFYQLSHGDAYPRALGMFTTNSDDKNKTFWRYLVRPPKSTGGYGGNVTHSRIGDLAVFDNGTVAATTSTPCYDNDWMNTYLPADKRPCYSHRLTDDALSVKIWNDGIGNQYPKNVFLHLIPSKSKTLVVDGSIGICPEAINLSGYAKGSHLAGALPKTAVVGNKVLVAWLSYSDYGYNHNGNLSHSVFCLYDTATRTVVRKDSVPGAVLFHTVSILSDPTDANKVKWITPEQTKFVYHELSISAFETSGLQSAYSTKDIPLQIENAATVMPTGSKSSGQFGPLGWYGSNPDIDYVIDNEGNIDLLWLDRAAKTTQYTNRDFYPLYVTTINSTGQVTKVVNIQVRASK